MIHEADPKLLKKLGELHENLSNIQRQINEIHNEINAWWAAYTTEIEEAEQPRSRVKIKRKYSR